MGKSSKIVLIALVVVVGAVVLLLPLMVTNANKRIDQARQESVTAANETLTLLLATGDPTSIELRTTPGLAGDAVDTKLMLDGIAFALGSFTGGSVDLSAFRIDDSNIGSPLLVANLKGRANYEHGVADVDMTMTREPSNAWMLDEITIKPVAGPASGRQSSE